MGIEKKLPNGNGSLNDIQILINYNSNLLNDSLRSNIPLLRDESINWLSPLKKDDYSEYYDDDFINLLGLNLSTPLSTFWPKNGCHWDALGKSENGQVFLVEAKAHIPEIVTDPSGAGEVSKKLIDNSLQETKAFLNIKNTIDWSGTFYQYTNRLAHLYFLRVYNNIPAWLVNIYFINDKRMKGPATNEEWMGAIQVVKAYLGVGHHKLSKYMIDVFIDMEKIE